MSLYLTDFGYSFPAFGYYIGVLGILFPRKAGLKGSVEFYFSGKMPVPAYSHTAFGDEKNAPGENDFLFHAICVNSHEFYKEQSKKTIYGKEKQ
ncbi:MAG: hypothetical protein JWO44_297 [Bacteroidetes bacterium]|nr:hypothetical protein [Bacteroidota bacterium]